MKNAGFLIGHSHFLPHAALASQTLSQHVTGAEGTVTAVVPAHADFVPDIPGIQTIQVEIPKEYRTVPFADKMMAAAALESSVNDEFLWLDVESCFCKPLRIDYSGGISVNPVDIRNVGIPYGQELSPLWKEVAAHFHLPETIPPVQTTVSGETIYPYYNVGMVAVHEPRDLFAQTVDALKDLLASKAIQGILQESPRSRIFIHQVVFSCCLQNLYTGAIHPLPDGVNYPMHLHGEHHRPHALSDLISIRYEEYFQDPDNPIPPEWRSVIEPFRSQLKPLWYY